MQINLYDNKSDNRYLTKTLQAVKTIEGTVRGSISVEAPVVVVKAFNGIDGANYAQIPEKGRYYYIVSHRYLSTDLVELVLKVDPLMSFAEGIKGLHAIVSRNTNNYYAYIPDGQIPVSAKRQISTYLGGLSKFDPSRHSIIILGAGGNV